MRALTALLLLCAVGCAGNPQRAATAEPPRVEVGAEPAETAPREPARATPAAAVVPPPPAECADYVERAGQRAPQGDAREQLALALGETDAARRDALLAGLESDAAFAPGLIRALRADLGPEPCADALAEAALAADASISDEHANVLGGLALAGKLSRLATAPPQIEPPLDKPRFLAFFEAELKPWLLGQAAAIGELSIEGSRLTRYGKAVAALAAGTADLRFVDVLRDVPLPDEMKSDPEVRDVYYAALDEALEPRKQRGRDAVLVALRLLSHYGVAVDPRISRARALLAKLYAGSRVDALDRLLLPPLPPAEPASVEARLAATAPSYYAGILLANADPTQPALLRALLERGLPPSLRAKLDRAKLDPKLRGLYARGLVELGKVYFQAAEFRSVLDVLGPKPADDEARLLFGISTVLAVGPADVTELMFRGAQLSNIGSVAELDGLAASKGRLAGLAAFDAAYLLELAPRRDDPSFWDDLGRRYGLAGKLLTEPAHKALAADYERAAVSTASTLRKP